MSDEREFTRKVSPEGGAVLFNATVRALTSYGFRNVSFNIGGKKSRRRYVTANAPDGTAATIWIKVTFHWIGLADVLRFPWSKSSVGRDDTEAAKFAIDDAERRGATHLAAVVGSEFTGQLSVARLISLLDAKHILSAQQASCAHPMYVEHGATLVVRAHHIGFGDAAAIADEAGENILAPRASARAPWTPSRPGRSSSAYVRDAAVRNAVLNIAAGHCERCRELGFLTTTGDRYLEAHHVVGMGERGPDTIDNVVALCANCHRQAHHGANKLQVERDLMRAIRRRGSRMQNV